MEGKQGGCRGQEADLLSGRPGLSLCSGPFCSFKSCALYGTNLSQAVSAQHLRRRLGRSGVISNNHIPNKQDAPFGRTNRKHVNKPTNHQKYKHALSSQVLIKTPPDLFFSFQTDSITISLSVRITGQRYGA